MAISVNNIRMPLGADESELIYYTAEALGISADALTDLRIKRSSVDARKKNDICFEYTVEVTLPPKDEHRLTGCKKAQKVTEAVPFEPAIGGRRAENPIVVAGFGPAGIFAAYTLAKFGYRPIVIERGRKMENRRRDVETFWNGGGLSKESNAMFGEGGAGTFSDGKLTTRIKDPLCNEVLSVLVKFGAPEESIYQAKPHIGTDNLGRIVTAIRREIIGMGGSVRFETALSGIVTDNGRLSAVKLRTDAGEEILPCDACVLAVGQNADDTYEMLFASGIPMQAKPYAAGVRIEHPRRFVDEAQFGKFAGHPRLGSAEYHMADKSGDRGVYTFCMCPGGKVVACSNDTGRIIVNGMSEYARNADNSNAAIVVQVRETDFDDGPLGGLAFRKRLERRAFEMGGGNYYAPASSVGSFFGKTGMSLKDAVTPSYRPGVAERDLVGLLPDFMAAGIRDGIAAFGRKMRGFDMDEAVLTAVESRTSAPVRILRGELGESLRVKGLYPCGEGAGYAGGIVSAAVDGMRSAMHIMAVYRPLE